MHKRFIALLVASLPLLCAAAPAAGAVKRPAELRALLQRYRCPIIDRLVRVHDAGDPASDRDRYIAINVPEGHYVQCMFHDHVLWLYCEAASGYYDTKPGEPRTEHLPAAAIAGLARLGFSTDDSHGNFTLDREIGARPDYRALADLILAALYIGYDARAELDLRIDAPFAPFAPLLGSTCEATS